MTVSRAMSDSAEIPLPVTSNPSKTGGTKRLRKGRYLGVLLYILQARKQKQLKYRVSRNKAIWIQDQLAVASVEELKAAQSTAKSLHTSARVRSSMAEEIERILKADRTPSPWSPAEKRRIGVGYRDKGTLRSHHKPREEVTPVIHLDDVEYLLPLNHQLTREELYTAEEVMDQMPSHEHTIEALLQLQLMTKYEVLTRHL